MGYIKTFENYLDEMTKQNLPHEEGSGRFFYHNYDTVILPDIEEYPLKLKEKSHAKKRHKNRNRGFRRRNNRD